MLSLQPLQVEEWVIPRHSSHLSYRAFLWDWPPSTRVHVLKATSLFKPRLVLATFKQRDRWPLGCSLLSASWYDTQLSPVKEKSSPTHTGRMVAWGWLRHGCVVTQYLNGRARHLHKQWIPSGNSRPGEHPPRRTTLLVPTKIIFTHFYTSPSISHMTSRISQPSRNSQPSRIHGIWVIFDNSNSCLRREVF